MSSVYDKLFMDFGTAFDDDKIITGNNSIISKLRKQYLKIISIDNYESCQSELYGDRTKRQIIELELSRIKRNDIVEQDVLDEILNIEKLLKLVNDDIEESVYEKIVNLIIKIELSLDMDIGLFKEVCKLYRNFSKMNEGLSRNR